MSTTVATDRIDQRKQAVTGVVPPQVGEALIRETWPALSGGPLASLARLAQALSGPPYVFRPIAWLLLLPAFVLKIAPFVARRYQLTNRRLLIARFGSSKPLQEIA